MPISSADQRYLENKHRGGVNNSKGNDYENLFAIYKISGLLLNHRGNLVGVVVGSQIHEYIDDFYIKSISDITYYQIKNVRELSWNYGSNSHTLKGDCILQKESSISRSEDFKVTIVYSDENSSLLPVPDEISQFTTIEFFPFCESVNNLLFTFEPFQQSIKRICFLKDPKNDDLLCVATALLGVWCGMDRSAVNLDDFYKEVIKLNFFVPNINHNESISVECKYLFESYSINYDIVENILIWNYNNKLQGKILWNEQKDQQIVNAKIKNFWDLIKLLY